MLKIFVGGSKEHRVPYEVLRHSIVRYASIPVEVRMLGDCEDDERRIPDRWRRKAPTSFSFQRFLIPRICAYEGRAVYLDSDQVVLGDVAELAALPFGGADDPIHAGSAKAGGTTDKAAAKILTTGGWQSAVMVLNCAALTWDVVELCAMLDRGEVKYHDLSALRFMPPGDVVGRVPPEWNCMDASHSDRNRPARLIHYTGMRTQPWLRQFHPHGAYWNEALAHWLMATDEKTENGRNEAAESRRNMLQTAITLGFVRPSLMAALTGCDVNENDEGFILPDDRRKKNGGVL